MLRNPEKTLQAAENWLRQYFEQHAPKACAVIGISGGKDSSVTAAICAAALGKDRVIGVLMPDGTQTDIEDSRLLISHLGIRSLEINIGKITSAFRNTFRENAAFAQLTGIPGLSRDSEINFPARIRMSTLYAVAQSLPHGGLVINTCNRSEDFVGYSTKFGDSAGDLSLLSAFAVHEVLQLGAAAGLPGKLLKKAPSDGLSGLTDEDKLGFTYAELDRYMETGLCEDPVKQAQIERLHRQNLHKIQPMPYFPKHEEA